MTEFVIVIPDLYLPPDSAEIAGSVHAIGSPGRSAATVSGSAAAAAGSTQAVQNASPLAGLERIARFGRRRMLEPEGSWRPWLARALGRSDLTAAPPAAIVAQAPAPTVSLGRGGLADVPAAIVMAQLPASTAPTVSPRPLAPIEPTAWLASPLHLIAGLTSLHLDRRSLLRLSTAEAEGFATGFNQTFGDPDPTSRLRLQPLASGEFLLEAPASFEAITTEPARALVQGLESSLPRGPRATPFKRLGAELEMWLHAHPLNEARRRRGELPVSTLWLWGGGPVSAQTRVADSTRDPINPAVLPSPAPVQIPSAQTGPPVIAFGSDPYLVGLATLSGVPIRKPPDSLVVDTAQAARAVLVIEVTPLLHANPQWTLIDAVADIDRRFLSPALAAINASRFESVTLIANNIEVQLRRNDRFKFWRPRQPGLTGLIPR